MKSRLTVAIASLVIAAAGTAAYAQASQQTPPPQSPPPAQPTQPMASAPMTANTPSNASSNGNSMSSMSSTSNSSSSQIDHKIMQALTSHGVTATHVKVSFSDGTATLTGSVITHADIAKAKKAAMGVHGVHQVDTSGLQAKKG